MKLYAAASFLFLALGLGLVSAQSIGATAQASSEDQPVLISKIDFFGYAGLDIEKVRAALPIHDQQQLPLAALLADKAKTNEAVQQVTGHPATDVARVCCDSNGHWMVYIGLAGESSKRISLYDAPTGSARLPHRAQMLYEDAMAATQTAVQKGAAGEDDSKGYSLSEDPELRSKQLAMRDYVLQHQSQVIEVLERSASKEDRRAAAGMLGYANRSQKQIDVLVHASRDPDSGVRNNAVRALLVLASSNDKAAAMISALPFIDMLSSGSWTDRNKGGGLLLYLTKNRDPGVLAALRSQALVSLFEMAQWQEIGHAGEYRTILGRLAGLDETQIQKLSQQDDGGRALIAAVRQAMQ